MSGRGAEEDKVQCISSDGEKEHHEYEDDEDSDTLITYSVSNLDHTMTGNKKLLFKNIYPRQPFDHGGARYEHPVQVTFYFPGRTPIITTRTSFDTMAELKTYLCNREGFPPDQQRLIHNRTQMEDHMTLEDCNAGDKVSIYVVLKLRGD